MHRETHTATLYSRQPRLEPGKTPVRHHRACFDFGLRGVLHLSSNDSIHFHPENERFEANLSECYAGFGTPFNIDFEEYVDLGPVELDLYVREKETRRPFCPQQRIFLDSHQFNHGMLGHTWYAHRPSETVYMSVGGAPSGDDPLLTDTMGPKEAMVDPVGLQNVETGLIGQIPRDRLRRLAERDALTTVLPVSVPE